MENVICPRGASRYTVREGDTLEDLARRNRTTQQALRLANEGRDLGALTPGMEICIPPQQLTCVSGDEYTVKPGDSFQSIARAYGISTLELQERNPFVEPSALSAGDVLCVPKRASGGGGTGGGGTGGGTVTPSCPQGNRSGTVRFGETVEAIALRFGVSYLSLLQSNPTLIPGALMPGQRFCVPPVGARKRCPEGGRSYIIGQGETLQSVAADFGIPASRLLLLNQTLAPGDFLPGVVICVG